MRKGGKYFYFIRFRRQYIKPTLKNPHEDGEEEEEENMHSL